VRRHLIALGAASALTLVATTAWAYWSAGTAPGANGAAAASAVNQGATPTASATGSSVTVSWAASTLATGRAVSGYLVKRYDATTQAAQTILSACTGTVAATSCVESNVPNGSWKYTVTPVFATNWRGPESARSAAVTVNVDTTAPTNSITLSSVTGGAFLTGTTVYYRGSAAGGFRLTNAVADGGSGPASSSTAALSGTSAGWAHTASTVSTPTGGPYVSNPFSWASGTTSSPGETVTGRDVAGNTAAASLTFSNDSTPPTAGTIGYTDGFASGRSASISFTTGTDAGSGVATKRLQRAVASINGTSCGPFGQFNDIGSDAPASPYADASLATGCYKYRYVVTDRVGNQQVATSANVVKVGYVGLVGATDGLLSYWRLGDDASAGTMASDSFTDASGRLLTAHSGELNADWSRQSGTSNATVSDQGRIYRSSTGYTVNTVAQQPVSADYSVEADLVLKSRVSTDVVGVVGRLTSSGTYYAATWEESDNSWNILRYPTPFFGSSTLASVSGQPDLNPGQAYRLKLEMTGSRLNLYVDGVLKTTATNGSISAPGLAGIQDGSAELFASNPAQSNTTGIHLDNFAVTSTYRAMDSQGPNHGEYANGVTRGVSGALAGDPDSAASFDGVDDNVQVLNPTGLPLGSSSRSVEAWFKTTSSAQQVLFDYGSLATAQEFGLWIDAGAMSMTAWGWGGGNDYPFSMPAAVNNGAWHQVVLTYGGGALTLYLDGTVRGSYSSVTRNTVMNSYGFAIGAVLTPGDGGGNSGHYFNGSIDEVSFYTSVLTQAQVADHYELAGAPAVDIAGPTGGAVDATGLVGTDSRYATSTSLSLTLAKGTDPSGVAASGSQVLRATAPLSGGSCGSYGTYAVVPGGTDPASPLVDTVADQACYSYQYVVADTLGNSSTYTSPDIKVDTTAPAAPGLALASSTNTWWPGSGSTAYYRSAATSGSFTVTASATDAASGIAGYAFPALGAGWTSTPGAAGVTTYSWSGVPAAPGTKNVTATNNAGLASANAPFTLTADSTAPSAGTVSYVNGTQAGTSVAVTFTTGTDSGSGVGTRLLQRAAAPLSGSTCGSFGAFATVADGTNPSSPFTDTVTSGGCYKYQYVVADNVGNSTTATSANVVKVKSSYSDTILGTSGLLNYYRLGESVVSSDSMSGPTGTLLQSRSGETAAGWTKVGFSDANAVLTDAGRIRKEGSSTSGALYYASATPQSADYTVEADVYVRTNNLTNDMVGVVGRLDTSNANGTYYLARYEVASQKWMLYRRLNGSWDWLAESSAQALTQGSTYRLALDMKGTAIRVLVDGVQVVSVTDSAITGPGRAGVSLGFASGTSTVTNTTGLHLDNFRVTPAAADSKGSNTGTFLGGVGLGTTGAIAGDSDTAASFDGGNDFGTIARSISDNFSIEFWFRSSQGIGTGTQWWSGAGLVDGEVAGATNDFGVSLRSDGRIVAGIGAPDVSIISGSGGYNNGAWHHVVFTRNRASGALALYVDGASAGTATGASTASLTAPAYLNFGRLQTGLNYLVGSLDEVGIYNSVLSAATVSAHYAAGQ
jgi:hypothetical protein